MKEQTYLDISEFYKFNKSMENASNVEEILDILIKTVNRMIPDTDMAIAYLYDSEQKVLRLGAGFGVSTPSLEKIAFRPGESMTGKVFLSKEALACSDRKTVSKMMSNISTENLRWYEEGTYRRAVKSSINVPLMDNKHCIGTFTLNRHSSGAPFSEADIKLLLTLTGQAARTAGYVRMSETLTDSHMKEHFSQILIRNGGRREILSLLEEKLGTKFFLDSAEAEAAHSIPIIHNKERLGRLTTVHPLCDFSSSEQRTINHAVDALSIVLGRQLNDYEKELDKRSEYMRRALNGGEPEDLYKYLSVTKDMPVYCIVISAGARIDPAFSRQLDNSLKRYLPGAAMFLTGSRYVVLSPAVKHLADFAAELYSRHGLTTGAGNARPVSHIAASYNEAVVAADQPAPPLVEYSSLGSERLWHGLDDRVKRDFVTDHIGPLLELGPEYLSTLGALIDNGRMQKTRTADRLYIHANTLYQRIRKMEAALGISFQNEHQWMDVMIAYRMYVEPDITHD